jgi:hypothetical protein
MSEEPVTTDDDALKALGSIITALEDLSVNDQERILASAAVFLGIEINVG